MTTDFYNAFERHFKDAEMLFGISRWANAYQLYGYSAECALKCIMQKVFSITLDPTKDFKHFPDILTRYETYRTGAYAVGYELPPTTPFYLWTLKARYAPESDFDQAFVEPYKKGTSDIMTLIVRAMTEGLI
jgi:hypothetical protein